MIKARVIKSFYYAKNKDIYLDEDRFKELEEQGYVEKKEDEIHKETIKPNKIEKATQNDKARVLSN